jgi:hypothetical protein
LPTRLSFSRFLSLLSPNFHAVTQQKYLQATSNGLGPRVFRHPLDRLKVLIGLVLAYLSPLGMKDMSFNS